MLGMWLVHRRQNVVHRLHPAACGGSRSGRACGGGWPPSASRWDREGNLDDASPCLFATQSNAAVFATFIFIHFSVPRDVPVTNFLFTESNCSHHRLSIRERIVPPGHGAIKAEAAEDTKVPPRSGLYERLSARM